MSDTNIPDPTAGYSTTTPEAGVTPPAPAYVPPAYSPTPVGPGVKQGLSLASFILGLVGFLLSFAFGVGFLPGLAAVITGFIARKREPDAPKWMWLVGIIAGFVAILSSVIVLIALLALVATATSVSHSVQLNSNN
jgi:hypothetical protein